MPVASPPPLILAASRTPFGAFGGGLKSVPAPRLAACAIRDAIRRAETAPPLAREVILGSAFPAGCGPEPARQATLEAGLGCPSCLVSMGAASGLKAVILGARSLSHGEPGWVVAGGMESSSRVPYLVPGARWGRRVGALDLIDGLLADGYAEDADPLPSIWSEWSRSRLRREACCPLSGPEYPPLPQEDEDPRLSRVPWAPDQAPPADGAAILLLGTFASRPPLGRILGWAEGTGSVREVVGDLLGQIGLAFGGVDLWECHEGSEARMLAFMEALPEIDPERLNVQGGALAMGDPRGASGARMIGALLGALAERNLATGVVVVPTEGGQVLALALAKG